MKIQLDWGRPIPLKDGTSQNLIYVTDVNRLPDKPGIYIFGRQHGEKFEALYVGKADVLQRRIKDQFNNLKLMRHLQRSKNGQRVLMVGRFVAKRRQIAKDCLPIAERSYIRHFLSEGHDLANKQGTKLRRHEIESTGNHPRRYFPTIMFLERRH